MAELTATASALRRKIPLRCDVCECRALHYSYSPIFVETPVELPRAVLFVGSSRGRFVIPLGSRLLLAGPRATPVREYIRQQSAPMKRPAPGIAVGYGFAAFATHKKIARSRCRLRDCARARDVQPAHARCGTRYVSCCIEHVRCTHELSMTAPNELPRKLGLVTGTAVVVGVIIGSGIFRVPSPIASAAGNLFGVGAVWILGGHGRRCSARCRSPNSRRCIPPPADLMCICAKRMDVRSRSCSAGCGC